MQVRPEGRSDPVATWALTSVTMLAVGIPLVILGHLFRDDPARIAGHHFTFATECLMYGYALGGLGALGVMVFGLYSWEQGRKRA
jgi:hypothetical protein